MTQHRSIRDFDWTLIGLAAALTVLGLVEIHSATLNTPFQGAFTRQLIFAAVGAVLFLVVSSIDYNKLVQLSPVFYVGAIVLLSAVLVIGQEGGGAQRWIALPGGRGLQISEFVKGVLVLAAAKLFTEHVRSKLGVADLLKAGAVLAVPLWLVKEQPDLTTALSYVPIFGMGLLLAGLSWRYILGFVLLATLVLPLAWYQLEPYQQQRIITFADPGQDPKGAGYQIIQSKVAVGSGGIWGKGIARGSQTQEGFLPVPHTDFIFAAYAEETGFIGVVLAMSLYFVLLAKIGSNALVAADAVGTYICMGVAAVLFFHILVNIGMVVGRMPVTGLPLPLMSYGGSNLLATFLLLGLVNNVHLRRFTN